MPKAGFVLFGIVVALCSECRSAVEVVPPSPLPAAVAPAAAPGAAVTRTGYTVQVGAFSVLENARRLVLALNEGGLDAYYYPQGAGLFRVRFGDFPSRDDAVREAERVLERKLVGGYFIVGPESHPIYRRSLPGEDFREKLIATARGFIGVEYAWGGTSRDEGVDCSGLVRAVYRLNGLSLPRSMTGQYLAGATVSRDGLQKGDLVFFSDAPGRQVSHVGIYVGGNVFIHAPGRGQKVREASLDGRYFRERFSGARAYLD
jgi:hypothetical protein